MSLEEYRERVTKKTARAKYGNKKTVVDGVEFDSEREATRYRDLVLMQKAGEIKMLRRQVNFPVYVLGKHICDWYADFTYKLRDDTKVVEDCKGVKTPVFQLKRKLVEAIYEIRILLT
jgi:hypothetical protein